MVKKEKDHEYHAEIVRQLGALDALLAGFSFAGLTLAAERSDDHPLTTWVFVAMSVTTIIFVVLSIIGAFLGMVTSRVAIEDDSAVGRVYLVFLLGSYAGIVAILASVSLLAFTVGTFVGVFVSALSTMGFVFSILCIYWIGTHFENRPVDDASD